MSKALARRRIMTVKLLVSQAFDECLHPRTMSLFLCKFPIKFRMGVSVDPINSRPVRLPFVTIIKPVIVKVSSREN